MITVGIPTVNSPAQLQRCLKSISACTDLEGVRVVVCDDGSSEENLVTNRRVVQHESSAMPGLALIENGARRGIAHGWNRLSRHYPDAGIITLLNDDTEVVPHWREALEFTLLENPVVGMVGLNAYLSITKRQHADVYDEPRVKLEIRSTEPHERILKVDYNESKLLDAGGQGLLSSQGAAFAFRREAYDKVGGFDERYFVYYEELDFGVSLWKARYKNFILSYPIIFHMGGATNSRSENLDAQAHMDRSKRLFEEKWSKGIGDLREELRGSYVRPQLREWNTQLHNWK